MKYRIVQKVGHGGYWIQKSIFGLFWIYYDAPLHLPGTTWYAHKEWAEWKIKELLVKPQQNVVSKTYDELNAEEIKDPEPPIYHTDESGVTGTHYIRKKE